MCQKSPHVEVISHPNTLQSLVFSGFGRFTANLKPEAFRPASRSPYRNLSMWPAFTRISQGVLFPSIDMCEIPHSQPFFRNLSF